MKIVVLRKKLHDNSIMYPESLWPYTSGWKSADPGKFLLRIENAVYIMDMQLNGIFYFSTCYILLMVQKINKNQPHNRALKGCLFVKHAQ